MPRGIRRNKTENTSSTDLGALQREIQQIAEETKQLKEKEKELAQRKAEVERNMAKALKDLGIFDMFAPRAEDGGAKPRGRRGRKPKSEAGEGSVKAKPGSKRYTPEERQAAVAFVDKSIKSGSTITDAIEQFNKQGKPRGKAPMNYQSLLRWRVA